MVVKHYALYTFLFSLYIPSMNWIPLLSILPRNAISQAFGVVARANIPLFSTQFRNWFVRHFQIDLSDAAKPLEQYANVHELFVRELIPTARPIADSEVVSPVDGVLSQWGILDTPEQQMIQAKGRTYSLSSLLRSPETAAKFQGGVYAVIYLAPFNYHRIHSPVDGELLEAQYCPGTLWPVNVSSVQQIDELFCVNERLTSYLRMTSGGEALVVKVGATNVGRISLAYTTEIITNSNQTPDRNQPLSRWVPDSQTKVAKGSQLGAFELGSTVVLVFNAEVYQRNPQLFQAWQGKAVRVGQSLL